MDHPHLRRAYDLAQEYHTHPNPRVGAVLVGEDGDVIGEGAHEGAGTPHAEVVALERAGAAEGATLYVSLEPCTHHGNTPPCVDRLIEERVARVIIGAIDPDERVAGTGAEALRRAGIDVIVLDDPDAEAIDPGYFHHRRTGLPLVTLKYAMTLDGSVAAVDGTSQWITSEQARMDAHHLRAANDAVLVGTGTIRADDPRLDVRIPGYEGRQPRPVIITGGTELPGDRAIWERNPVVVSPVELSTPSGDVLVVGGDERPGPEAVCRALAGAGFLSVLLEGGPTLAGAWLRAGVVSRGVVYIGARVGGGTGRSPLGGTFGSIGDAVGVAVAAVTRLGPDVRIDYSLER